MIDRRRYRLPLCRWLELSASGREYRHSGPPVRSSILTPLCDRISSGHHSRAGRADAGSMKRRATGRRAADVCAELDSGSHINAHVDQPRRAHASQRSGRTCCYAPSAPGRPSTHFSGCSSNVNVKVEPTPTWLSTHIRPPCSSTNLLDSVSPRPVPSTLLSAVPTWRNSSKTAA